MEEFLPKEELAEKQKRIEALYNDPRVFTRMVTPEGETTRILPSELDKAVQMGYKFANPDAEIVLKIGAAFPPVKAVKASEAERLIRDEGLITAKADQYMAEERAVQNYIAQKKAAISPTIAETALSAASQAASGFTVGLSDLGAAGVFKLAEWASGKPGFAKEAGEQLLELRDATGGIGTAAEILGGIGQAAMMGSPAGLVKSLTGKAINPIAAASLFGAGSTLSTTAGRQALGDETIDTQHYLFSAGLGGVFGAVGEKLGQSVSKLLKPSKGQTTIPDIRISTQPHTGSAPPPLFKPTGETLATSPKVILQAQDASGVWKPIGEMTLSRGAADAYHNGSKIAGVTVEGISLFTNAPVHADMGALQTVVNTFGSAASPSSEAALTASKSIFSNAGVRKIADDGSSWFLMTPDTIPKSVVEDTGIISTAKRWMGIFGKAPGPEDGRAYEVFEKIFDPTQGIYRREFLDFKLDPTKRIAGLTKDFFDVDKVLVDNVKRAEKIRAGVGKSLTTEQGQALKQEVLGVLGGINANSTNIASKFDLSIEAYRIAKSEIDRAARVLSEISAAESPADIWSKLLTFKRDLGKRYYGAKGSPGILERLSGFTDAQDELSSIYKNLNSTLKSKNILGEKQASRLLKLDKAAEEMIQAEKAFKKQFAEGGEISPRKIAQTYTAFREGTLLEKAWALDKYQAAMMNFDKAIRGSKYASKPTATAKAVSAINKINKYKEFMEVTGVLEKAKAGTAASGAAQMGMGVAGSFAGTTLGGLIGMPTLGSGLGAAMSSMIPNRLADPLVALRMAQKASASYGKLKNVASKLVGPTKFAITKVAVPVSRVEIARALGTKPEKDDTKYLAGVRQRVMEMSSPEYLAQIRNSIGDPLREEALIQQTENVSKYVLANLPNPNSLSKVNKVDMSKANKLLFAAAQPQKALSYAVQTGDSDLPKHLQAMFPLVYEQFQKLAMNEIAQSEGTRNFRQNTIIQKTTGIPVARMSTKAVLLAQSVFSQPQQGGIPNVSPPPLPVGEATQKP